MNVIKLGKNQRLAEGLLNVDEIADETGLSPTCVRYYKHMGFLKVEAITQSGLWLFNKEAALGIIDEIGDLIDMGLRLHQIEELMAKPWGIKCKS